LRREYGFSAPQLETNEKIKFAYVTFMAKHIAVECILDQREEDITVKIVRVLDGKKTPYYAVDKKNAWVRQDLFGLLRREGAPAAGCLRKLESGLDFSDRIPRLLDNYAEMLKKYGKDVLDDSPTALD
jgi:hypothetical protein